MCFFGCFLCLQEGENVQKNKVERKNQEKKNDPPLVWRVLGAFYSFGANFEAAALQPQTFSDKIDLDMSGMVLTSCFWKGMDLENRTVGSKVMALRS